MTLSYSADICCHCCACNYIEK